MVIRFILLLAFVGLILPAYANVVGPDGINTCQRIQMEIDAGAKRWYLVSTLIENMDNSIDGNLEIIDSDCFYQVVITDYYDGKWTATIQLDGSEKKEFDFIIKNGKITDDEFGMKGLAYDSDNLVFEFTKLHENVCYGYAEFTHAATIFLKGDVDCSDGISMTINAEIDESDMETIVSKTVCSDLKSIELVHTINDGKILESCIDDSQPDVIITVESDVPSQLTVEIPRTMVYSINQECESDDDLFILVNGEEVDSTIQNTPLSRIITLDFPSGHNTIDFIGSYTLGLPVYAYCGILYGYDSVFMPPRFQVEHGLLGNVLCNEGLEVVKKSSNESQACVAPETTKKLIERGWEPGICNSINASPYVDFSYCSFIGADFSGKDLQGANLYNTRFEGANLSGADLQGAEISRTYFVDANLSGADLRGLDIASAILKNTNITKALVTTEYWGDVDLDALIGWKTIIDPKNILE